jgi:hypothetical protein
LARVQTPVNRLVSVWKFSDRLKLSLGGITLDSWAAPAYTAPVWIRFCGSGLFVFWRNITGGSSSIQNPARGRQEQGTIGVISGGLHLRDPVKTKSSHIRAQLRGQNHEHK